MSMPWSLRNTVTRPIVPKVAMNANVSVTPPNWARTPAPEVTVRRRIPRGLPVTTAYASRAPATAPTNALTAEMTKLLTNDLTRKGCTTSVRLDSVMLPSLAPIDPAAMSSVGRVELSRLLHRRLAHRPRSSLQPQILALVRVQVLLPEPSRGRMRCLLVDRLRVVAADRGVRRYEDLPAGNVLPMGRGQVVPLEQHGSLPGFDGCGRADGRYEITLHLQLVEEVHALADVVQRSTVGD